MQKVAFIFGLIVLFHLTSSPAFAQSSFMYGGSIGAYPDLKFPAEAKEMGLFASKSNGAFKPESEGPFPAVVLAHTCGGLQPHITDRAKELLAAGYLVLILDSYGPRNHTSFCLPSGVLAPRVYKDAYDALQHLSQMKEVDASRIYLVGLSLGSFVAASVSSPEVAYWIGAKMRFRASVGWYGSCTFDTGRGKWELIHSDLDKPVLMLMAKNDDETPIKDCFPLLDNLKAAGKPVSWHVYEDVTHGWDKSDARRGYSYNEEATKDAMRRTVEFLKQN
ncbi:MAG: dienelactone hydrolase family protein [Gammaproteobacteria bacterium]|nr:dienelactone hydrolase family protein [Gammaproteobacteria bacterium]MBU0785865.1 dienelactone hydrolase family protein [Gammaproteobacteria bacterium]MBU0815837.1 dienelactone hydrolase family protein [Gammaproteobacteria bacterium]MBU1787376.1 dienelactone hydrolase family protein [Gammaproteobacteria bacterium]